MMTRLQRRKAVNVAAIVICVGFAAVAVWPLFSVLWELIKRGGPVISWEFITSLATGPVGAGGGIYHAIIGTLMVVGIGTGIGTPVGVFAGIYLSEYSTSRFANSVRATADIMTGIPSIVAGLFGYAVVVTRWGFSAWAGGVALSLILLPIVARTTEEALRTVPVTYREASLALGAPRWYTTIRVVIPPAGGPMVTGILLAVARIAGESAPLLLTVLTSFFLVTSPNEPIATLPYLIYDYGKAAYPKLNAHAWGAALVLIALVLIINVVVRLISRPPRAAR